MEMEIAMEITKSLGIQCSYIGITTMNKTIFMLLAKENNCYSVNDALQSGYVKRLYTPINHTGQFN